MEVHSQKIEKYSEGVGLHPFYQWYEKETFFSTIGTIGTIETVEISCFLNYTICQENVCGKPYSNVMHVLNILTENVVLHHIW